MLKFPVAGGIFTLKSIKIILIKCATVLGPEGQSSVVNQAVEERIKVAINPEYPEQTIMAKDWKVESLYGFPFKCFLDAYKGYHQIKMAKEDEEKTTFITSQGIFCYSKMPFSLRNAGATYQRLGGQSIP
ncbi:hypothetical protein Tco_0253616 [Tanacetum coccineum]